jgi:predicted porin
MWRLTLNWIPIEPLSLSFRFDEARDQYSGRGISVVEQNARKGEAQNYSVDAAYVFSEAVTGTAWYSRNTNRFEAQSCRAGTPDVCVPGVQQVWGANLRSVADSFGLGLRAKVSAKLEVGADVTEWKVRDEMPLTLVAGAPLAVPLPDDINTKVTTLKLDATYALQRNSGIRVVYVFDRYDTDDWTWANWAYSPAEGGTTVLQEPSQRVHFIGVSYYYRFQ